MIEPVYPGIGGTGEGAYVPFAVKLPKNIYCIVKCVWNRCGGPYACNVEIKGLAIIFFDDIALFTHYFYYLIGSHFYLVAGDGFEPPTFGLWAHRATPALSRNIRQICIFFVYYQIKIINNSRKRKELINTS